MDETTEKLLARLEQATSSEPANSATTEAWDDETVTLHESWLALGKLLDAADRGTQTSNVGSQKTGLAVGKLVGFVAAVAASLLVALAVWTVMKRGADSLTPQQELAAPGELPESPPAVTDVAEVPQDGESSGVVDEFAWEDSFDEQLAATSQAIRSVRANWNGGDQRFGVLLDQFEQFDAELSEGSL